MTRRVEPVESTPNTGPGIGGRRETHPAFGVAIVTRGQGTPRTLFQSDLQHNETITLRIETAERDRDLHRDWVHPRESIVEVEMSLAQWGALVSSIGLGSGVPVTIRSRESLWDVPLLPYEPRIAENIAETRAVVADLLENAKRTLIDLDSAIEGKQGVKAVRDALRQHAASLANAESNAAFAVKSLKESAESVVAQARADIESQIMQAQIVAQSQASIEAPSFTVGELES